MAKPKQETGLNLAELERQRESGADIEFVNTLGDKAGDRTARRVPVYERWGQKKNNRAPRLTKRQVAAADEFRAVYELAEKGTVAISNYNGEPLPESYRTKVPTEKLLDAIRERVMLKKLLGETVMDLLTGFCIFDRVPKSSRWEAARHVGMVQIALEVTAEHFRL
ncbi:MAG: hypothetical protein ACR2PS_18440 [Pseudomonadales bacterium]